MSPDRRVAPLAGAWVEIQSTAADEPTLNVAPLAGAWVEIPEPVLLSQGDVSRSPRGSVG